MSLDHTLVVYFRRERRSRGLSLRTLAARTGVSKSALGAWERGAHLPSLPELDAVLTLYGIDAKERMRVLSLMDAPRARREIRRSEGGDLGPAIATPGAILQAMRVRRGRSLVGLGRTLGIAPTTVGRWERGETWPSAERFGEVLEALEAAAPEREALTRAVAIGEPPPFDLRAAEEFLYTFRHDAWGQAHPPFIELTLIRMAGDLWQLALGSREAEALYRETCGYLAYWYLLNHGAMNEALAFSHRALAGDDGTLDPTQVAWPIHIVAKDAMTHGKGGPRHGIEYLQNWLPRAEHDRRISAWYRRDIAEFVAATGELDSALVLSTEAIAATIAADEDPLEAELDHARLLLQVGRPEEALPLLPMPNASLPLPEARLALTWAEALLGVRERDAAAHWWSTAERLIEANALGALRPQLRSLTLALAREM